MAAASNATVLGLCGNGKARDHCFLRHLACKEYTLLRCCVASVHLEAFQAESISLAKVKKRDFRIALDMEKVKRRSGAEDSLALSKKLPPPVMPTLVLRIQADQVFPCCDVVLPTFWQDFEAKLTGFLELAMDFLSFKARLGEVRHPPLSAPLSRQKGGDPFRSSAFKLVIYAYPYGFDGGPDELLPGAGRTRKELVHVKDHGEAVDVDDAASGSYGANTSPDLDTKIPEGSAGDGPTGPSLAQRCTHTMQKRFGRTNPPSGRALVQLERDFGFFKISFIPQANDKIICEEEGNEGLDILLERC
ncbi:hypothetical protein P389DRAFT_196619 [Cystobasidium minutum MCA 4210]|uniref:uncharacterized protein n=1 Tax=Cystobasidium minutum MCA 4210 TaxID=1397322 RepID=UPI0034CF9FEC|eukprot:jgi/Rhomi1/196619/gm1.4833_g